MTDLSPVASGPTETRSTELKASGPKRVTPSESVVKKPVNPPVQSQTASTDKLRLSFTSQAKLLRQEGLSPAEIAANLGVTEAQVQGALESAQTVTAALTSSLNEKA